MTFEARRSAYVDRLVNDPDLRHLTFTEVRTDFEFLLSSNWYLSVRHADAAGPANPQAR